MITIFIYDTLGEDQISFFTIEGNYSHLHGTYLNKVTENAQEEKNQKELYELIFDEDGQYIVKLQYDFPIVVGDYDVITCGFLP